MLENLFFGQMKMLIFVKRLLSKRNDEPAESKP